MSKQPLLVIVTDCGGTDRGRYEIAAHRSFAISPKISFFETVSMNTLHAGFIAAAHAISTIDLFGPLNDDERIGLIVNAAPRHGRDNGRQLRGADRKAEGEKIYALRLRNGVWVVGPNAGMNFRFFDPEQVAETFLLTGPGLDTPFRSMEFMVPAIGKLLGQNDFPVELIPQNLKVSMSEPGIYLADWDKHGNMYIYSDLPAEEWIPRLGEFVTIRIGEGIARLRHVDGIFAGTSGEPTLTTGSLRLNGKLVHYIVVVGGDAHGLFKNPKVGSKVEIER